MKKILVIGDVSLEPSIHGKVDRISPEAPVAVVLEGERSYNVGCAANVAANVAALGGHASLAGVVGQDSEAKVLAKLCRAKGIKTFFCTDLARPTTLKTRVFASRHQLLRIDRESHAPLSTSAQERLKKEIASVSRPDIIIISDYMKGVVTHSLMEWLKKHFGGAKILADIKPEHASFFKGIRAITPNLNEALEMTGVAADSNVRAAAAAKKISRKLGVSVVLTRGEYGMTIFEKETGRIAHIASRALQVYDVSGAGDTVIAALAIKISEGSDLFEAAAFANKAAGVAVGRHGVVTVTREEVENGFPRRLSLRASRRSNPA